MSRSIHRKVMKPTFILFCLVAVLSYCIPNEAHYLIESSEEIYSEEFGQSKGKVGTNCTCGTTNRAKGRIVGGKEAEVNEYPHMAAIFRIYKIGRKTKCAQTCGGAIVTKQHVITAAHCVYYETDTLGILTGVHDIGNGINETQLNPVTQWIYHPNYDPKRTLKHDIALLVMKNEIEFNALVGPVCLPRSKPNLSNQYVKISGWGDLQSKGPGATLLMKVWLRVISIDECAKANSFIAIDTENPTQFCTFGWKKDSCQGDSGGPVTWVDKETNRYILVGVVSYGKGCATTYPGVNTDVYQHMDWIQHEIHRTGRGVYKTCSRM